MNRRHVLQRLACGFAGGALLSPSVYGQATPPRVAANAAPVAAPGAPGGGVLPRAQPSFQVAPEVLQVLNDWERYTKSINKLEGQFIRYVYDSTFLVEKRANGEFWYEAPDKGRIDFKPARLDGLKIDPNTKKAYNPLKTDPKTGTPYTVQADASSRWICRGDMLVFIDDDQKTYETVEIPPHMRGQNITASPLPFLFGVSAQQMLQRYYMALGSMHDPRGVRKTPDGRSLSPVIHIVATPALAPIAKEWSRAEVLLDPGLTFKDQQGQPVYVPSAIRLLDPTGNTETVYMFQLDSTKLNKSGFFRFTDPFKDPGALGGLKFIGHHRQAAEPQSERRDAETPGRATVK